MSSGDGLQFVRTIAPDDWVLDKLIQELARRRIAAVPQVDPDGHWISKPAHIVILSEWDTLYGRSLGTTFAAKASAEKANDISEHSEAGRARIDVYHYLRGIDGRLPGDAGKDNQLGRSKKLSLARPLSRPRRQKG